MAASDAEEAVLNVTEVTAEQPWLGTLDIVIITLVLAGIVYWFFSRKKPEEPKMIFPKPVRDNGVVAQDNSFVRKMESSGRNVVVFYGSQTGTAEELAGRLAKDASRFGMKGIALDPEECDMEELPQLAERIENSLAIFCMATYGEGDPTDNAQEFYEFLQRGGVNLSGITYAVFALGNKTYEHFNAMGKFTDKRLAELGAKRIYEMGSGDDDGNLEEDFMLWREGFWPAVCDFFDVKSVGEDVSTRQYRLTVHEDVDPTKVFKGEHARLNSFINQRPPFDLKNPYLAPVVVHRELHKGGDRSCMHIEFDIAGSKLRYEAGDHAAVYPSNDPHLIARLATLLGVELETVITLTNVDEDSSKKHPFPCPCSYRTALLHYVDLLSAPRTHVLKELAEYCKDSAQKEFLKSMTSAKEESRKLYSDWIVADRRTIVDVIEDLPSCRPPLDHLLEMLPRLQPRYYSISSSPKSNPDRIAITAVLVSYETRLGRNIKGVATSWLALKRPFDQVPIFVRKSQLRLPHQARTPVIMIGPGTGVAPFRGFIQDRFHQRKDGKEVGPTILYFGCRSRKEDFIYEDELEEWKGDGTLHEVHTAFSRDQAQKVYVQHLLRQNAEQSWKLIQQQSAHIYVCGDARNMARDVHEVFVEMAVEKGKMTRDEAIAFVKKLENQKRYQADVWS